MQCLQSMGLFLDELSLVSIFRIYFTGFSLKG